RVRIDGAADPVLEAAVDAALAAAELEVVEVELPGWLGAGMPFGVILLAEAWEADRALYERAPDRIGDEARARLELGRGVDPAQLPAARAAQEAWAEEVSAVFASGRVQLLAMPTMPGPPPGLDADGVVNSLVFPWNVARSPALALPMPVAGWSMPGSLQLIGPQGGDELLCATGAVVEAALA
ncbi:MAG TPA: amidase family protein, partial [Acidimicrobiales bacterium]|nr:amidase family protein [Acidimicrobiales bacterium]